MMLLQGRFRQTNTEATQNQHENENCLKFVFLTQISYVHSFQSNTYLEFLAIHADYQQQIDGT